MTIQLYTIINELLKKKNFEIISLLLYNTYCVKEISNILNMDSSRCSKQLIMLYKLDIISRKIIHPNKYYSINPKYYEILKSILNMWDIKLLQLFNSEINFQILLKINLYDQYYNSLDNQTLCSLLPYSQPTISKHLKKLRENNIIILSNSENKLCYSLTNTGSDMVQLYNFWKTIK